MDEKDQWKSTERAVGAAMAEYLGFEEVVPDYLIEHAENRELRDLMELIRQHNSSPDQKPDKDRLREDRLQEVIRQLDAAGREVDYVAASCRDFIIATYHEKDYLLTLSIQTCLRKKYKQHRHFPMENPDRVNALCDKFGWSAEEGRIISFFYILENSEKLRSILNNTPAHKEAHLICSLVGTDLKTLPDLISPKGRLSEAGVLLPLPFFNRDSMHDYKLNSIVQIILQTGNMELIRRHLLLPARSGRYLLEQFAVPEENILPMLSLLGKGKQLLISGRPGTGKTEFAHAIAAEAGVSLLSVTTEVNESYGTPSRKDTVALASRFVDSGSWLLIDEADSILSTGRGLHIFFGNAAAGGTAGRTGNTDSGAINTLIEQFPVPGIWIVNDTEGIPMSTLRRFAYVYPFPEPDLTTRKRMLREYLEKPETEMPVSFIDSLASNYRFTPSAIQRIEQAIDCRESESEEPAVRMQRCLSYISTMSRGPAGEDFSRTFSGDKDSYDEALCNTSISVQTIADLIKRRTERQQPLRLLFSGPPGGGKTSFALHLSTILEREILVKKPSDLLSKYVGEAEKQVARMFREAEDRKALLLIDEADAFFIDRNNMMRSWEMSQASEWLQGVQSFSGILIACTNRAEAIDPALRRRFHRDIRFDHLTEQMVDRALDVFFPDTPIQESDRRTLYGRDLMISDFAAAAEYLRDLDSRGNIVEEILSESELRNPSAGKIGF